MSGHGASGVSTARIDVLAELDDEQRQAATCVNGPLLVVAPAGSGKTRTISRRIAHAVRIGTHEPAHTLAVSFTNRAAGQLREQLMTLGVGEVASRTFHSAALMQLRFFWEQGSNPPLPRIRGNRQSVLAAIAGDDRWGLDSGEAAIAVSLIDAAKSRAFDADRIGEFIKGQRLIAVGAVDVDVVADVYKRYEDDNLREGFMDFDDVLARLVAMLDDDSAAAATVQRRYRHITVDEFQDASLMQRALLRLWTGPSRDICVVGDRHQSIYGFAGVVDDSLAWFRRNYPGCEEVALRTCYRSSVAVVEFGSGVRRELGETISVRAHRADRGIVRTLPVQADDSAEAEAVAAAISESISNGVEPSDIAVLFRIGAQARLIREALAFAGVPVVDDAAAGFFSRPAVMRSLTLLRGMSKDPASATMNLTDAVADVLSTAGWRPQAPSQAAESTSPDWLLLEALSRHAQQMMLAAPETSLADFIADLDYRREVALPPVVHAVSLLTVHASKGLEWAHVYVIGVSQGLFPFGRDLSDDTMAEEKRLFYVAATRAAESLTLSAHGRPSPFLPSVSAAS